MKKLVNPGKIIIPAGTLPEMHELAVANILAETGKDIEFLKPIYAKGVFTPDLIMDGQRWEIKSPTGCSKRTIENNFRSAQHQSENIIFDLRRVGLDEKIAVSKIKREIMVQRTGKTKRVIIITKNNKLLDFCR
jgi:hypothetical protein